MRIGHEWKLQQPHASATSFPIGLRRFTTEHIQRHSSMHNAKPVEFRHCPYDRDDERSCCGDRQRPTASYRFNERCADHIFADKKAMRFALLKSPGATDHRIGHFMRTLCAMRDGGPDIEPLTESCVEQA